jgi:alpha-galactosidase
MRNDGNRRVPIDWFPAYSATWYMSSEVKQLDTWESLTFRPMSYPLDSARVVSLSSRLHSSDNRPERGWNPFWAVRMADGSRAMFAIEWCGGWKAFLSASENYLYFDVRLPHADSQLTLNPGEEVHGPIVHVTFLPPGPERDQRAQWMHSRAALAESLYGGPGPSYPFTYNNWYETRFDFDGDFISRQVAAMAPYDFDAFIVDAGWYTSVSDYTPDTAKFAEGQFEGIMAQIAEAGVTPGIWSCPQFLHGEADTAAADLGPTLDVPGQFEPFIHGWLRDLAGMDFTPFLKDHVAMLRERYHAGWWKYDQILFASETRHGAMKNVIAFQEALKAVRAAQPDLYIENCQSGGRMLNEFTVLATQTQWILDGGASGMPIIRRNIESGLRALEFLPPWTVSRWSNRPWDMEVNDEMTRALCRSAMMGVWGIVSDLDKITPAQRATILRQRDHYRRLNELKAACRYDVVPPVDDTPFAYVTFYDAAGANAGILCFRWDARGDTTCEIPLEGLDAAKVYAIADVDAATNVTFSGQQLIEEGYAIPFPEGRLSALVWIDGS